ncbi:protein Wnt-4-like [Oppia nitens]|uniref:protein Wnt-4-like n=1 Tax=Oppia nitens TaxID=1686743 RepID=UPI0023DAA689|nr:protein Wnt-4-like [Oppia nitens]
MCDTIFGLTRKQRHICRKNIEVMDSVKIGALRAVTECQHQFRERRWNCSSLETNRLFTKIPKEVVGTREAAFVYAIQSAGIAHAVTKYCSNGQLTKCGCDRTIAMSPAHGFQWAGCSDNIAFGIAFAKTFVDSRDLRAARSNKPNSVQAFVNLHNTEAGRKVIHNHMKIECKCHGVSGSCELKTCWRSMPSFRQIGDLLKDKFESAAEVRLKIPNTSPSVTTKRESTKLETASMTYGSFASINSRGSPGLVPINLSFKPPTDVDLVYLNSSPDFCEPNNKTGSLGTYGRQCNRASKGTDGCDLMCCGRGYHSQKERIKERCNCKFHWCCYVECDQCIREVLVHTCK